jgi:hypothetical protein
VFLLNLLHMTLTSSLDEVVNSEIGVKFFIQVLSPVFTVALLLTF